MAGPAPIFRGSAVVTGVGLDSAPAAYDCFVTNASPLTQSAKMGQVWEEEVIKDNQGQDAVWIMRNEHATLDCDLIIVATTAAIAALPMTTAGSAGAVMSGLNAALPITPPSGPFLAPGSILTLTNFIPAAFNGVWRVVTGGDCSLTNTGAWKYTLKLLKYAAAAQNTAFSTIPT